MKNTKGFIVPLLVAIIAVLVVGGVYVYNNKKESPISNDMVADVQASLPDNSLLAASLNTSNNKNKISTCGEIIKSGNYTLDKDIHSSSGVCLNIHDVKNFSLNCNNHKISSDYSSGGALNVKNVNGFSIQSCVLNADIGINNLPDGGTFAVLTPSFRLINSNNGVITKNNIQGMYVNSDDSGPIANTHSTKIDINHNTFNSGGYDQVNTDNSSIAYNNMSLGVSKNQTVIPNYSISTTGGSNNLIANNTVDGGWNSDPADMTSGADNGVAIGRGEKNTIVKNNTLKNFHNAGIETPSGFVSGIQIIGNTIDNAAHTGILSFWQTSWLNNTVKDNIVTNTPSLFWFVRNFGLWPGEKYMYFLNNTFNNNSFSSQKYTNASPFNFSIFNFWSIDSSQSGTPITASLEKFGNNIFTKNNFGVDVPAPQFFPSTMIVDGGGNICGSHGDGPYPLDCSSNPPASTDWQTYTNTTYNFQIQYPKNGQLTTNVTTPGGQDFSFTTSNRKMEVLVQTNVPNGSYSPVCNSSAGVDPNANKIINGISFTNFQADRFYSSGNVSATATEYCVMHSGIGYILTPQLQYASGTPPVDWNSDPVLNQMLSSFKFTK